MTVTVTDENEGPEVTGTSSFTIAENQRVGRGDLYRDRPGGIRERRITRGGALPVPIGGDFEINEDGELSFRKTPDYEKPVGPRTGTTSTVVTVRASDGRYYGDAGRGGDGERPERSA